MLYIEKDHPDTIRFETEKNYSYVDLLECDNPFCNCSECQLVFLSKEEYSDESANGIPLLVDVLKNEIIPHSYEVTKNQELEASELKELIPVSFTAKDWDLLKLEYIKKKQNLIEYLSYKNYEYDYHFSEEHLNNQGLLISYQSIFPYCKLFEVEKDGKSYEIVEQYCKNSKCECTDVNLQVFNAGKYVEDFTFNYKSNSITGTENKWIVKDLLQSNNGFKKKLENRDLKVKYLFALDLIRIHKRRIELLSDEQSSSRSKVGRNELCPCGSGKKYKKCCLMN